MRFLRLFLPLGATLLLLSCQTNPSLGPKLDSTLQSYVPQDTTLLAGLNVRDLLTAPFYQRHAAQFNATALNGMTAKSGIDLRRDVSYALLPFRNGQPVVLARGTFDPARIKTNLGSASIVFPEKGVAVAGPSPLVRQFAARKTRGIPESLLTRIRSLPAADQVWIVSSEGLPLAAIPISSDAKSMLSSLAAFVTAFQAGISLDSGAHVQISLQCDSSEDAKQLYAALRGGIGLARLTTKDKDLALLKLYDAVQITSDAQSVDVRADLSPDLADQLLALLQNVQSR